MVKAMNTQEQVYFVSATIVRLTVWLFISPIDSRLLC